MSIDKMLNNWSVKPFSDANHIGVEIEFISKISKRMLAEIIMNKHPEISEFIVLKEDGSIECENDAQCSSCEGNGTIMLECDDCNGQGKFKDDDGEMHVCDSCGGDGYHTVDCSDCDGSGYIEGGETDCEAVICAPENKIKGVLKKLLTIINEDAEGYVNKSCGLHVHLDMRNRNVSKSYRRLFHNKEFLFKMLPDSRLFENRYCQPNEHSSFISEKKREDRYLHFNPTAYDKYRTLEIRMHTGTINYNKITNWIDLLVSVVDNGSTNKQPRNFEEFKKRAKITRKLETYMKQRAKEFNKELAA